MHGAEDETYIEKLRQITDKPIIKAFVVKNAADIDRAKTSRADFVLLDTGAGEGLTFNWALVKNFPRDFFLAGGLNAENINAAIAATHPFAVDVSSGIESAGQKDFSKMKEFIAKVRN